MKKQLRYLVFLFFFVFGSHHFTNAQASLNFYANGACPLNGLADSNYRNGIGFSVEFLSPAIFKTKNNFFEIRLGAGFEFFHHENSNKVNDLVFDTPNNDLGSVKTQNQMSAFYFAPKFVFNVGSFSPYFDVFGASRTFYTDQINRFNNNVEGYERQTSNVLLRNSRAHYGGSLGLLYKLNSNVAFDARVSYSTGTGIKFINGNSVERDLNYESNIKYSVTQTLDSDVLVFRLGVLLTLKKCKDCPRSTRSNRRNNVNPSPSRPPKKPATVKPVPKPQEPEKPINY